MLNPSNGIEDLKESIRTSSSLYYFRATPFTEHGEFNYNGALNEEFFFEHMFSEKGKCDAYISNINKSLKANLHKSVLLIGNQGCGKTTFVHHLKRNCKDCEFIFFDFDADTSNPTLAEYIEKLSAYLFDLINSDTSVNKAFYNMFVMNEKLITTKINASNNIKNFFAKLKNVFIDKTNNDSTDDFINEINKLYFNQILSLIVLWHLCKFEMEYKDKGKISKLVFCLDNLDVLVNKEIIENFFSEYFRFVRNVDSIIQKIDNDFIRRQKITYNKLFAFIFSCRQHTWARVKERYRHDNNFVRVSTLEKNITDAFDKREILKRRTKYIYDNKEYYGDFKKGIEKTQSVLNDMDVTEKYSHNIYDLFNDDYRQCNITFEEVLANNTELFDEYSKIKYKISKFNGLLYGARGMIYKALFDEFKQKGIFDDIGILDISADKPLVSNARMILNYLNYHTYSADKNKQKYVSFERIVNAFDGIISRDDINNELIAMFKLGYDSPWNELIAFNEIHSEEVSDCKGLEIFITKAGHEYLSLIATHFEFFNTRITKRRTADFPLFSEKSMQRCENHEFKYNFQEIITLVKEVVDGCCRRMVEYYENTMKSRYENVEEYLKSPYVYSDANVMHGERIIHTHIRYIDTYRLHVLNDEEYSKGDKKRVNKLLVGYIEDYMRIGEDYPRILTEKSTDKLFPEFKDKIKIIKDSEYEDFKTRINIKTKLEIANETMNI